MRQLWNRLVGNLFPQEIDRSIRFWERYFVEGKMGDLHFYPKSGYDSYKDSGGADPDILRVWKVKVEPPKLSVDVLKEAEQQLSKADYHSLLQDLWWDHCFEDFRFKLWRRRKIKNAHPDYFLFWLVIPFLDRALKLPYDWNYELPSPIPDSLYIHHGIHGYPKIDMREVLECRQEDGTLVPEKKARKLKKKFIPDHPPFPSDPKFYGEPDKICAIQYEASDTHIPTGGIVREITEYYTKRGWKPLAYDLCFPYQEGSIHAGWLWGRYWSQFWIDGSAAIAYVTLMVGRCEAGEVKVFTMYSPNAYVQKALDYYEQVHPISQGIVRDLPIPDYERFHIFPIPPYNYGMSEELLSYKRRLYPVKD